MSYLFYELIMSYLSIAGGSYHVENKERHVKRGNSIAEFLL